MKSKIRNIVFWPIFFLLLLFCIFFIVFSVIRVLYDYGLVSYEYIYWLSISISFAFSFGIMTYVILGIKKEKRSHIRNLLYMELPNIGLFCTFLVIFSSSIDSKVVLSRSEVINIIDISWTIFSISITIFLVWNVIIFPYLKRHEPVETEKALLPDKYKYIVKKGSFYVTANRMYSSIVLLSVNLFALALSTCLFYVGSSEIVLLTQFFVKATIILSLNSIISLFFNILIPINEEKKELLKYKRVNSSDIDSQNELVRRIDVADKTFDELEKNTNLDDETKLEIMKTLLKGIIDVDNDRHHADSV